MNSVWEEGRYAQRWSLVVVTVRNEGEGRFKGAVRLVPIADPGTGKVGDPAPLYEAPVSIRSKAEKRVPIFLGSTNLLLRPEVRDTDGEVAATGKPLIAAPAQRRAQVGILTDNEDFSQLLFKGTRPLPLAVSRRFSSPHDFPADPAELIGLDALVMTDVDSARLSNAQLRTVLGFVAVGGTLVVTGGTAASKVVSALPEELAPLRPSGSIESSFGAFAQTLAPFSEPSVSTADAAGVIATGDLKGGSVRVENQGVPLMVERKYGWGRTLQLTFDLFAAPSAHSLQPLLWAEVLSFRGSPPINATAPTAEGPGAAKEPGSLSFFSAMEHGLRSKATPGTAVVLALVVYGLLIGAAILLPGRSKNGLMMWPLPVLVLAGIVFVSAISFSSSSKLAVAREVQIHRLGPGGADLVQSEVSVGRKVDRALGVNFKGTVLAWPSPGRLENSELVSSTESTGPPRPANGDVAALGTPGSLRLGEKRPWSKHGLTMQAFVKHPSEIQAKLRLENRQTLIGEITNHGKQAFGKITLQSSRWGALAIADKLTPGSSVKVNMRVSEDKQGQRQEPEAYFRMAFNSVEGGQNVALVGRLQPSRLYTAEGRVPEGSTEAVFVAPLEIQNLEPTG